MLTRSQSLVVITTCRAVVDHYFHTQHADLLELLIIISGNNSCFKFIAAWVICITVNNQRRLDTLNFKSVIKQTFFFTLKFLQINCVLKHFRFLKEINVLINNLTTNWC